MQKHYFDPTFGGAIVNGQRNVLEPLDSISPFAFALGPRNSSPIVSDISPDLIGGTELGGVIIATAVSQMTGLPMIVVRKQPKQYGAFAAEYVEGPFSAGQHVLLLEDVVTSGRELLAARARLEELNLKVTPYAIIARGLAPVSSLIQFSLPRSGPKTDN